MLEVLMLVDVVPVIRAERRKALDKGLVGINDQQHYRVVDL